MVRKTLRSTALKASEKTRRESPRRTRRRKSSSRSDDSAEDGLPDLKKTQSANRSEKGSSGNESDTDSKKPLKKRTRSMAVNDSKKKNSEVMSHNIEFNRDVQQDDEDEVNEENISKGKSKSITKSINENVNPETENENVQVTDESPNDAKDDNLPIDELSKNGTETSEIDVNISQSIVAEMTCDNQSSEITSEQTTEIVILEHIKSAPSNIDENSSDLTQVNSEEIEHEVKEKSPSKEKSRVCISPKDSQSVRRKSQESSSSEKLQDSDKKRSDSPTKNGSGNGTSSDNTRKIKLNRLPKDKNTLTENQTEKLEKNEEHETKKKITLKRPESKQSILDDVKQQEGNHNLLPKEQAEGDGWTSFYESTNKESKHEKAEICHERPSRKRITLKRSTIDDVSRGDKSETTSLARSSSLQENNERRKSFTSDNIIINELRRCSSGAEKSTSENEEKVQKTKKPTKVVKIIRKLPEVLLEPPPPGEAPVKKYKWNQTNIAHTFTGIVNLEVLKEVCPTIEFLNEADVDLEIISTEKKSPEKVKRKTFTELEEEEMENIEAELNAEPDEMEIKENIIAMNRKISIVDDTASKLNPPPSPAKNPLSEVLFITNLVRPFTVKQLKELLERTGKIRDEGFWTDRIKSKCYVYYETAEEAESTRNALHGVHWPIGNGKKLIIDYATVEDMENAKNPPVAVLKKEPSPEKENKKPDIQEEKHDRRDVRIAKREWDDKEGDDHRHRRSHSKSRDRREKKHSRRSYTPEGYHNKKRKHEEQVPQKAMDDLFLKTKATPSIYWQPLSPEEIARKQQQRQLRLEENKRRLEEIRSSGRGGIRDRSGRDRNFRRR